MKNFMINVLNGRFTVKTVSIRKSGVDNCGITNVVRVRFNIIDNKTNKVYEIPSMKYYFSDYEWYTQTIDFAKFYREMVKETGYEESMKNEMENEKTQKDIAD